MDSKVQWVYGTLREDCRASIFTTRTNGNPMKHYDLGLTQGEALLDRANLACPSKPKPLSPREQLRPLQGLCAPMCLKPTEPSVPSHARCWTRRLERPAAESSFSRASLLMGFATSEWGRFQCLGRGGVGSFQPL